MPAKSKGPTFIRGLAAVIEDFHVNDGVDGSGLSTPPPAVPLPQLPRPRRRRRRRWLTARVRRPSGRVQVKGAAGRESHQLQLGYFAIGKDVM